MEKPLMPLQDAESGPFRGSKLKSRLAWLAVGVTVIAVCLLARTVWGPGGAQADGPFFFKGKKKGAETDPATAVAANTKTATDTSPPANGGQGAQKQQIMAVVNGETISRNDLARDCLQHYGVELLDTLLNKELIVQTCKQRNIQVTPQEVKAEIERNAQRFNLPMDQWLKLLQEERHLTPQQYAQDIIWPTLALRKLAASRLEVSQQELQQAYETQFGRSVQARIIVCKDLQLAQKLRAQAAQNPEEFGNLAKEYSIDTNSASSKGLIQPIRMHLGDKNIEQAAFSLRQGEVSDVITVGSTQPGNEKFAQYVILKCEAQIPPHEVPQDQRDKVHQAMVEALRDKKLRLASTEVFDQLKQTSHVENIYSDERKRAQYPGVAAIINDHKITIRDLAEECIDRHGVEVLDGAIGRKLLEQACKKRNIVITQQDMDAEVARAAISMGKVTPDNRPDIPAWIKEVTEEQGIAFDLYMYDTVWPTVALKKLVGSKIEVTSDDLQKGFEANYGPRVRCRAIVFNNQRLAQEVWGMIKEEMDKNLAMRDPPKQLKMNVERFGDFAEQYSIESSSRVLRGEVPPIQRFGGQPKLEEAAFKLRAGELSEIVQVEDKFVLMLCEGKTVPKQISFETVRDELRMDIHEKKLRVAMSQEFSRLHEDSDVLNNLANTTHSPRKGEEGALKGTSISPAVNPATALPPGAMPVRK
jgi:parvulin-like peptidyl-prolyl isomerase